MVQENPETREELKKCKKQLVAAETSAVESEDAEVIQVEINGTLATIVGGKNSGKSGGKSGGEPSGAAGDVPARTQALAANVRKSRNSMQRCYQSALKKNSALQARPTTVRLQMGFNAAGSATSYSINPTVSTDFKSCLKRIAMKWKVPQSSGKHNIGAKINLTPQ